MAIRSGKFYSPWPLLDSKLFNQQLGEIRSNQAETKALVRQTYQELETDIDELNANRALVGQAYGNLDFHNKYRIYYESNTEEFTIQKNDGTVDDPEWTDMVQFRNSDGQLQSVGSGGIYSPAGFYPEPRSLGEVAESGSDADTSITNVTKLFFNTDDGLEVERITSGTNAGHPQVRVSRPFGQAQEFAKRGRVWEVEHNYGITPVLAQVMDDNYQIIIPDKADLSNPNIAYFYFNEVFSGSVYIASGGVGAASLAPRDPFYLVVRTDEQDAADNTIKNNADLIFDSDYFYVNVDLDTGSGGAHKTAHINLTNKVFDHGTLVGLTDDDHTQYSLADGTRNFTNDVTIKNSADGNLIFSIDSGSTAARHSQIRFKDRGAAQWVLGKTQANAFMLYDEIEDINTILITSHADNENAIIVDSGNVGIGTNSPSAKLNVNGHVRFEDTLNVENAITAEAFYTTANREVQTLTIRESDSDPTVNNVNTIVFSNASLTDDGGGQVTVAVSGLGVDHGTLDGLSDDDHKGYILADGTRAFSGDANFGGHNLTGIGIITGDNRVDGSLTAEAFYVGPAGIELSYRGLRSSDDLTVIIGDKQNTSFDKNGIRVTDKVEARRFYFSDGGEAPTSYVEEFSSAVEWAVNHNLNRPHFIAQAFKNNGSMFIPDSVYVNDKNIAYFYFANAQAGKAVILGMG